MRASALLATGLALASLSATAGCGLFGEDEPADLQVYSARHYGSEEVFKQFTEETGITVDFLFGEDAELLERIKAEGDGLPGRRLHDRRRRQPLERRRPGRARSRSTARPSTGPCPKQYRDSKDALVRAGAAGPHRRSTTPTTSTESELDPKDTYAGLADPKWKGRICMRDTSEAYTQSPGRLADRPLRPRQGARDRRGLGGQRRRRDGQRRPAHRGGRRRHLRRGARQPLLPRPRARGATRTSTSKLYWASQEGAGTHVNLSGAGVVATSDNKDEAQELHRVAGHRRARTTSSSGNHEFPVNPDVQPDEIAPVLRRRSSRCRSTPRRTARLNAEAVDLLAEAGYK